MSTLESAADVLSWDNALAGIRSGSAPELTGSIGTRPSLVAVSRLILLFELLGVSLCRERWSAWI